MTKPIHEQFREACEAYRVIRERQSAEKKIAEERVKEVSPRLARDSYGCMANLEFFDTPIVCIYEQRLSISDARKLRDWLNLILEPQP